MDITTTKDLLWVIMELMEVPKRSNFQTSFHLSQQRSGLHFWIRSKGNSGLGGMNGSPLHFMVFEIVIVLVL